MGVSLQKLDIPELSVIPDWTDRADNAPQKNQYIAYIERQMLYSYNNELKQLLKACSRQGLRVFNGTDDRASTDSGYRRT